MSASPNLVSKTARVKEILEGPEKKNDFTMSHNVRGYIISLWMTKMSQSWRGGYVSQIHAFYGNKGSEKRRKKNSAKKVPELTEKVLLL